MEKFKDRSEKMVQKEALARISINKLLEDAGWRFFPNEKGIANIQLEPNVKISQLDLDGLEMKKTKNGFIDYLLLCLFSEKRSHFTAFGSDYFY